MSYKQTTQKTKDWAKRTQLKPGSECGCLGRNSSCPTSGSLRITVKRHKHYLRWKSCWLFQTVLLANYFFSQCLNSIIYNNNVVVSSTPETDTKYIYYSSYSCKCIMYMFILQWIALLLGLEKKRIDGTMYWRYNTPCQQFALAKCRPCNMFNA